MPQHCHRYSIPVGLNPVLTIISQTTKPNKLFLHYIVYRYNLFYAMESNSYVYSTLQLIQCCCVQCFVPWWMWIWSVDINRTWAVRVLYLDEMAHSLWSTSLVWRQKGVTGNCFKHLDGHFCLRADELEFVLGGIAEFYASEIICVYRKSQKLIAVKSVLCSVLWWMRVWFVCQLVCMYVCGIVALELMHLEICDAVVDWDFKWRPLLSFYTCMLLCTLKGDKIRLLEGFLLTLTLPGPSAGVSGSLDSYCSLKPLCSGMGEVVPARTSPTLLPHPLALCCHYPVSKCRSASIAVIGTLRVLVQGFWSQSRGLKKVPHQMCDKQKD